MRSAHSGRVRVWKIRHRDGSDAVLEQSARVIANDPEAQCRVALMGLGVALIAVPFVLPHLQSGRLQRVLFNLIQNAIRHTPPDGTVIVRTTRHEDGVEIEVADSGAGIPAAERERVFEAFHRLDRSRTDDGAGLGLAISRAIVEAHGGRIWIADAERGTSVRVRLAAG